MKPYQLFESGFAERLVKAMKENERMQAKVKANLELIRATRQKLLNK